MCEQSSVFFIPNSIMYSRLNKRAEVLGWILTARSLFSSSYAQDCDIHYPVTFSIPSSYYQVLNFKYAISVSYSLMSWVLEYKREQPF